MTNTKSYYVRIMIKGLTISRFAGKTINDAKKLEAKIKSGQITVNNSIENKNTLTFEDFIDKIFKAHYESKNRETRRAFSKLNIIKNAFPNKLLSEITPYDVEKFFQKQIKINAVSTANNYLAYIKRIFNYALEMDYVHASPVKTKLVYHDNKRTRHLDENEKSKLLEACKNSKNKNLYAIVLIALDAGMRRGEIAAIEKEDITNDIITIKSETAKSKKGRYIPLTLRLQDLFKNLSNLKLNGDIKNSFHYALKCADIHNFKFHDLRHTFASDLVMKGVDIYTVSKLLGHATIDMTERYAHLAPSALKNAIDKLN